MFLLIDLSLGVIARTCIRTDSDPAVFVQNQRSLPVPNLVISRPADAATLQLPPPPLQLQLDRIRAKEDDREMFRRAMSVSRRSGSSSHEGVPKVVFMFLTKGRLPMGPLWQKFFRGHERKYSIYIHSSTSYKASDPKGSVFYGRRIPSYTVEWGHASMIDVERRLLENALLDPANERFVLLSELCIPVFDVATVHSYLINTYVTFVGSLDDPRAVGRGHDNPKMSPAVKLMDWRKGPQWFTADRTLAAEIISKVKYYPLFRNYCHHFGQPMCYMDEHYIPTIVNILRPETNANRSITWVYWKRDSPHPERFRRGDVNSEIIRKFKCGERCTYNVKTTSLCYLFGWKFEADAPPAIDGAPVHFVKSQLLKKKMILMG